jgi:hypothetical protein
MKAVTRDSDREVKLADERLECLAKDAVTCSHSGKNGNDAHF